MILKFRRNTPRNLILEASRSFAQVVRGELVENISFFLYGSCMLISVCHAMPPCMLLHGGCHAHPKKLFVSANRTFSTSPPPMPLPPPPPPQPSIQNYYWLGCALPRESFITCAYFKKDAMFFFGKTRFFCEGVIYTAERMLLVCCSVHYMRM